MNPQLLLLILGAYFILLLCVAYFTGKKANSMSFYVGNKQSPWYLVAFGMIGASLSGVTFISVPGWVDAQQFSYFQMVLGYLVGYFFIAAVLLPLYYRLNLTSIYTYLQDRLGRYSYKTGASFFLLSRTVGAAFRLFLVAGVMQYIIFEQWNVPFWVTVAFTILLIWLYTFKGGIRTIVWTDSLQTLCMLAAVVISIIVIGQSLDLGGIGGIVQEVKTSGYSKTFFFSDWSSGSHFFKQFISGAFIAIAMTGLDQDMMQKNLSCRNIGDAQKNMFWFSIVLVFVNILFLSLGALLFVYAQKNGIAVPDKTDYLFPEIAVNHLPQVAAGVFFLGLIAAAYSSADSALTALTTSFCIDILGFSPTDDSKESKRKRMMVHVGFSVLLFFIILWANTGNNGAVIGKIFYWATLTYGPLLGLYAFGLFTKWKVIDMWTPIICIASPIITYFLGEYMKSSGMDLGFTLLPINGLITFLGLCLSSLIRRK